MPRYWTSEGTAEVDFLLQNSTALLTEAVKSGFSRMSIQTHGCCRS